jgi:ornithine cyclodeaminase
MPSAIDAMRSAFIALAQQRVDAPQRLAINSEAGTTLLMGAAAQGIGLSSKCVSIFDGNSSLGKPVVNGLLLVLDPDTGEPIGLCDGAALTAIRTGAVAAAVTDVLADTKARVAALIGCGAQARTQLLALDSIRSLEQVRVFGPDPSQLKSFIEAMQETVDAPLRACIDSNDAIDGADIVTTATNSRHPVIDGHRLKPGCHVNGVGSYTLEMKELDRATLDGARIFVDQRSAALHEAGELVDAESAGLTERQQWTEIGALFLDPEAHRPATGQRSVFKSVGHAVQDVAAAALAFQRAREQQLGTSIEL